MAPRPRLIEFIRYLPADNRPGKMISVLGKAYPKRVSASKLMKGMGLSWQTEPVPSFVSLCIAFKNINRGLRAYGWQAVRADGTPGSSYWLSPLGKG